MRILIVSKYYYPNNVVVNKFAEYLASKGHYIKVLTCKPTSNNKFVMPEYKNIKSEKINKVHVDRLVTISEGDSFFRKFLSDLYFYIKGKSYIKKNKDSFDYVYSFQISSVIPVLLGEFFKKRLNNKHFTHIVDLFPEADKSLYQKRKLFLEKFINKRIQKVYRKVDKFFFISKNSENYLKEKFVLKNIESKLIPIPSLIEDLNVPKFSYDNKYINIVYFVNKNDSLPIIKICDAIKNNSKIKIRINLIGENKQINDLISLAKKSGIREKVVVFGNLLPEQVASCIKGADFLFFFPFDNGSILYKTISPTLITYLAFGVPIIACCEHENKEILMASEGNIMFKDNETDLSKIFKGLPNFSTKDRKLFYSKNKFYYETYFSNEEVCRKIEKQFQNKLI